MKPKDFRELFSRRLLFAREVKQLTQKELADKCGLCACAISHFETGKRMPSLLNYRNLIKALNINPNYLIGLE